VPYAKASATKTIEVAGAYAVPVLEILMPMALGAALIASVFVAKP